MLTARFLSPLGGFRQGASGLGKSSDMSSLGDIECEKLETEFSFHLEESETLLSMIH